MKTLFVCVIAAAICVATLTESLAQREPQWKGSGGWGPHSSYDRIYDAKSVVTLTGHVVSVEKVSHGKGMSQGIHLTLKTDQEAISVHLGPAWYIENQDIKIEPNDKVEITGSKVTFDNKPEIKRGGEVLKLRDATGFPVWAGWRKR